MKGTPPPRKEAAGRAGESPGRGLQRQGSPRPTQDSENQTLHMVEPGDLIYLFRPSQCSHRQVSPLPSGLQRGEEEGCPVHDPVGKFRWLLEENL